MKKSAVILILAISLPLSLNAQGNFREEYDKFRNQAISAYSSFREQCNREYVQFLIQAWEYYKVGLVIEQPVEEEAPPIVIEEERKDVPVEDKEIPFEGVVSAPIDEPQPQPVEPVTPAPVILETWFDFDFFGTQLKIRAEKKDRFTLASIEGEDVAKVWTKLSGREYDDMLYDCLKIRDEYNLCDWAYLLMLATFSEKFVESNNEAVLLTAYLYCQSGYKMRLGATDKELRLLFGTKYQIYGAPCYEIDGYYYYQLNGEPQELRVANFTFPKEQGLSLTLASQPKFSNNESQRRIMTAKGYGTVSSCSVNRNLLAFFDSYPTSQLNDDPMTRWALYANTPLDDNIKFQLYPELKKTISGKSIPQAADILLDFVQTAFEYEYDDKVWGGDRAFFSEETLFYPYCDCEDRSILFSRLVRDLLGLDVILVYYPGHLATAVNFAEPLKGEYITLNGSKYLVCDPTYIGAPIGLTMPDMDNKKAKVILLK